MAICLLLPPRIPEAFGRDGVNPWGIRLIEYCCTIGTELVLIQLSSDIAVYMAPPPRDTENGDECEIFCRSVRPAEPRQRAAAR